LRAGVRRIHAALRESGQHPLSLSDQAWNELFLAVEESGRDDLTLRPALASFQRYLVRSIDAAPILRLWSVRTEVVTPKASVIWAHEFETLSPVLDQMTPDPRIRDQLTVWTALLSATTLRFGELAGLQMKSVQLHESTIEIQVAPHRGHRPLKTAAARRIVAIQNPHASKVIRDWFERRKLEGADAVDYLFGDPADRRRLYRLGASYRIYSAALKLATSDPTVTIHGTRHAFLSHAAEDAFLNIGVGEQVNPLHRLAVLAGHEHEHTTLRTYVHLIEAPLRYYTDRAVQRHLKRHADIARWLGLKAATVRQRSHRLQGGLWSPWVDIERHFCHPKLSLVDRVGSSVPPEIGIRVRPIGQFKQFMQIAADLLNGHSESAAGARNSADLQAVSRVRDSILITALASDGRQSDLVSLSSRLNFSRLARKNWDATARALERSEARAALGTFWPALRGAGIDLEMASTSLLAALEVLRACGFTAAQFVLRYVPLKGTASPMPPAAMKAVRRFSTAFGATPQIEAVSDRRSRSIAYLLLLTGPPPRDGPVPPARSDIASLRAISICAAAFDHFLEGSNSYALESHT
jgi:integrase